MNNNSPPKSLFNGHAFLTLSIFLVGLVVGRMVEANMHVYAIATGLSCMAMYAGIKLWDKRKQNKKEAIDAEQMMDRLKGRIDKLITRESLIPYSRMFPKKSVDCTEQYVTVAHSQKRPKSATRFAAKQQHHQQQTERC